MDTDIVGLCGGAAAAAAGRGRADIGGWPTARGRTVVARARRAVVPTLCVIMPVRGHGSAALMLLLVVRLDCCSSAAAAAVHQFVLSIFVVLIKVAAAVVVIVLGAAGNRITSSAAGQRHLLLRRPGRSQCGRPSRTGRFRLGDVVHVDFQFGLL